VTGPSPPPAIGRLHAGARAAPRFVARSAPGRAFERAGSSSNGVSTTPGPPPHGSVARSSPGRPRMRLREPRCGRVAPRR
jgi:hypothetical protein